MRGISALMKEAQENSFPLPPCEVTAKSQLSMNQEAGPLLSASTEHRALRPSQPPNCEKSMFIVHKPPVYAVFVTAAQMN